MLTWTEKMGSGVSRVKSGEECGPFDSLVFSMISDFASFGC